MAEFKPTLVTDAEAIERLCPFMPRENLRNHVGGGFHSTTEHPAHCLGSLCMMWRWATAETPTLNEHMRGWCGVAGKPL